MLKWIKKKLLKWLIKDIKSEIPELKATVLEEFEEHKDELLDKCKAKLKETIQNFVASKINR